MSLKLSLSQKLQIALAAILFITGAGKLIYCRFKPLDALLFSIDSLKGAAGFEQDIQMACRAGNKRWDSQSPFEIMNDMLITINYRKAPAASKAVFTLGPRGSRQALMNGELYINHELTALTINSKTVYKRQGKHTIVNSPGSLSGIKDNLTPYVEYQTAAAAVIMDYGRPMQINMDRFSLVLEGDECINLIKAALDYLNWNKPDISSYLEQLSDGSIYAVFQTDDYMRLRGIRAELSFNEAAAVINMNTARVDREIDIMPPDIINGLDISNMAGNETETLFREFFDILLAGGNT